MLWQQRNSDAGKDQARKHCRGQDILVYSFSLWRIAAAEDYPLDFVVHSSTRLKGVGGGLRREVMQVGLEKPKGL